MSEQLIVNVTDFETRVALIESGMVVEVMIERNRDRGIVGNIYLGKVQRVLPGMQAAFVEIGTERAAFLYVGDVVSEPPEEDDEEEDVHPEVSAADDDDTAVTDVSLSPSQSDQAISEDASFGEHPPLESDAESSQTPAESSASTTAAPAAKSESVPPLCWKRMLAVVVENANNSAFESGLKSCYRRARQFWSRSPRTP